MRFQIACFLAFCAFSAALHVEMVDEAVIAARNQLDCKRLLAMSLDELSQVEVRKL